MRLPAEAGREVERAAPARRALDADLTAHQPHEARGDRQPQPGAAVPTGGRVIGLLERLDDALDHAQAAHVSAEAGHRALLEALKLRPLLDLGMRLGEGTGAALAVSVLRAALACHTGMATFAEAGVASKSH